MICCLRFLRFVRVHPKTSESQETYPQETHYRIPSIPRATSLQEIASAQTGCQEEKAAKYHEEKEAKPKPRKRDPRSLPRRAQPPSAAPNVTVTARSRGYPAQGGPGGEAKKGEKRGEEWEPSLCQTLSIPYGEGCLPY